jgi:mRNA interferase HigB
MKLINTLILQDFSKKHPDAQKSVSTWKKVTESAAWKNRQDLVNDFPNAKIIAGNRARFEIRHNFYRLIAEILYDDQIVVVRFIGTHAAYDKVDAATVNMTKYKT